ncbi:hypothetical protein IMY05_C2487001100 [Salix suchowensis]|nr:hypothetical protein IMY05_C2487001100 [Salix suchowensis]
MICTYLLGHPDKYTSHYFIPFYWRTYVHQVRADWDVNDPNLKADTIAVVEKDGKLETVSSTLDYIHRPVSLEDMCLYDFVMYCRREKGNLSDDTYLLEDSEDESHGKDIADVDDNVGPPRKKRARKNPSSMSYSFQTEHPLAETHHLKFLTMDNSKVAKNRLVVNFLGDQSWEESFRGNAFADRYIKVMKNFNLRYECLDSRDDFRSQMRAGEKVDSSPWMSRMFEDAETEGVHSVDQWQMLNSQKPEKRL